MSPERDPVARLVRLAGPGAPLEPTRRDRLEASFRAAWIERTERRRRRRRWLLVAATALAAVAGPALLRTLSEPESFPAPARAEMRVVRTEGAPTVLRGEGSDLVAAGDPILPGDRLLTGEGRIALVRTGGATVRFDRLSDVVVGEGGALELRSGALYADSPAPDATPLRIATPAGRVVEIGTRFQVRILSEDEGGPARSGRSAAPDRVAPDRVAIAVRSGAVALERSDGRWLAAAGEALLAPEATEPGGEPLRRAADPAGPAWSWVQDVAPPFALEGKTLAAYLEWVGAETGRVVRFADPGLEGEAARTILHGDLEGLRPDESLEMVVPSAGWAWTAEDDDVVISEEPPR